MIVTVHSVVVESLHTWTVGTAAPGATTLVVSSIAGFDESGGVANIGGYVDDKGVIRQGLQVAYSTVAKDATTGISTMTLTLPFAAGTSDRTTVLFDFGDGTAQQAKTARVLLPGAVDTCDADVPDRLWHDSRLHESASPGQTVEVGHRRGGRLEVIRIIGQRSIIDGSHLDPDKPATPGAITTSLDTYPDEYAAKIPPSTLSNGTTHADLTFGGKATIGPAVGGAQGLNVVFSDGTSPMRITDQGVRLAGIVDATGLRTTTGAQLAGPSRVPAGSSVTLGVFIDPPALGPNYFMDWPTLEVGFADNVIAEQRRGLTLLDQANVMTTNTHVNSGETKLIVYDGNPFDGSVVDRQSFTGAPTAAVIADINWSQHLTKLETLEYDAAAARWLVRLYTYTAGVSLVYSSQWVVTELGSAATPRPALTGFQFFGSEYLTVGRSRSDGKVDLHQYTDAVHSTSFTTTDAFDFGSGLTAVDIQMAQLGASLTITGPCNMIADGSLPNTSGYVGWPVMPVVSTSATAWPPYGLGDSLGAQVVANGDLASSGIATLDGAPRPLTYYLSGRANVQYTHSNVYEAGVYWLQTAWRDGSGNETLPSDPIQFQKIPGAQVTLTMGQPPPGSAVNAVSFYVGKGATFPGNSAMWRQGLPVAVTSDYMSVDLLSIVTGTFNPVTSATLTAGGSAGALKASDGTVLIAGDKTGSIYDLVSAGDIIGGTP